MELTGRLLPPPQIVFKQPGNVPDESQRQDAVFNTKVRSYSENALYAISALYREPFTSYRDPNVVSGTY